MFKRIIDFLFGAKLPCGCGFYRFRARPGGRVSCPQCGAVYVRAKKVSRSDKQYVDKCMATLEKAKNNEEKWTPGLLNMLSDPRFISFLEHSAVQLTEETELCPK